MDGARRTPPRWSCRSTRARSSSWPRGRRGRALPRPAARPLAADAPAVIVIFTIRSDNYERLQLAGARRHPAGDAQPAADAEGRLCRGHQGTGAAAGRDSARAQDRGGAGRCAARRHRGRRRQGRPAAARLHAGAALSRVSRRRATSGSRHYDSSAASKGSIEAAVERAFKAADADPAVPRDRAGAAGAAAPRPHPVARRHRSRDRRAAPPCRAAVRNPRRGATADRPPRRAAAAGDRCRQGAPKRPRSSPRTRRCCANGACCRAGSRRTPGSSPSWRASSAPRATGRQNGKADALAHAHDGRLRRCGASAGTARPRRQP